MAKLFLLIVLVNFVNSAKLPSIFEKCDLKKSDLDQCFIKAIEAALSYLETHPLKSVGLAKIEPIEVTKFSVGEGSGPVNVRQNFENIKIYGFSKAKISSLKVRIEKGIKKAYINITINLPEVRVEAEYNLNGQVLLLPVHGAGHATIIFKNVAADLYLPLEKVQKDGTEYIHVGAGKLQILEEELIHYNFENLFDGDKALGDNLNKVLNDNWKEIFDDVKSGYEKLLYEILINLANTLFNKIPAVDVIDNINIL